MAKTIIVNPKTDSNDSDSTALWVVLLVAFAVVLIALVGFGKPSTKSDNTVSKIVQETTAPVTKS